jgi:hypothetical protein
MQVSRASALPFAAAGAVSGALTTPLLDFLNEIDWIQSREIGSLSLSIVLAGLAFAIALAAALAFRLRFHPRQLLIIVVTLSAWYLALEAFVQMDAQPPKGVGESAEQSALDIECDALAAGTLTPASPELENSCAERKLAIVQAEQSSTRAYWSSLITHGLSGAIGALITVLGVPLATGRRFPVLGMAVTTAAGIAVAVAFFVVVSAVAALQPAGFYTLFVPWQAAVAAAIGRFLR